MIERQIVIGFIVSDEFLQKIRPLWNPKFLEAKTASHIASWCMEYYDEYSEAPKKNIEPIYFEKLRLGLIHETVGQEIEEMILPSLSEEYANDDFNLDYLLTETNKYMEERSLLLLQEEIKDLIEAGEVDKAKELVKEHSFSVNGEELSIDLSDPNNLKRIRKALSQVNHPVFHYPGAAGDFLNPQLIRGGFVAFMASEKRGKSFWLLDMAMRASRQKQKVAFFQAGDMTEAQQLRRIGTYLVNKPDQEKYTGKHYVPIKDCVHNQLNTCEKEERECSFGAFDGQNLEVKDIRNKITKEDIIEAMQHEPDYNPCYNCKDFKKKRWGSVWLKLVTVPAVMTINEAIPAIRKFFVKYNRSFRLSSHPNGTLSVSKIVGLLKTWEKEDGFVPDLIIIDYADILVPDVKTEFRHQQNDIWKALRGLSQQKPWLVVTVTQADAKSYDQNRLSMKNYSEDKRKYAHVTAMYGLNQDPLGREKALGLMWINELVIREGEGLITNEVAVLQQLSVGRPFITSFL